MSVESSKCFELLRIVERFATEFHDLPKLIPGRPDYRILISAGPLLAGFAVSCAVAHAGIAAESVRSVSVCPSGDNASQSLM